QLIEKVGFTLSNRVGHVVLKFLLKGFQPFIKVRLDGCSFVTEEKVVVPHVAQYFTIVTALSYHRAGSHDPQAILLVVCDQFFQHIIYGDVRMRSY
ncbi:MAG: hypothetical protein L0L05_03520, partial [Yaniella sp.]|nr:hypothetical protein [Yaniella sp.]